MILRAEEPLKPIPAEVTGDDGGHRIYKVAIARKDSVYVFCGEVAGEFRHSFVGKKGENWIAYTYRMASDNRKVEAYEKLGTGSVISPTQFLIQADATREQSTKQQHGLLISNDPLKRRAIVFVPKASQFAAKDYKGVSTTDFVKELQPRILEDGLIIFPVETGIQAKAVSCTCKSFFGCTTGCCTNPACKVVLGWCQSNSDCKKVDLTSSCNCKED